jgi:hypothetical protein
MQIKSLMIIEVIGRFHGALFRPGVSRYMFRIESYKEIDKINGS